ncbi:MAG: restriction endonuclease subunit S [Thermodesulfobacteriota bacterium]|nr:restriction endonuclease subunit S [Thermodesulfobacteriota bacterium]
MKDWKKDIFNNFIKLNRGFDLPNHSIKVGNYPVVASTSVKAYHNSYKVTPPCVVTGRSGSLGSVQYVKEKCWPLNITLYVKDYKGNLPAYVYYFLQTMHLENFNAGAGVPTLNQNHLHKLKINLPPLPIQKK